MTLAEQWRDRRQRLRALEHLAILQTMRDGECWYGYDLSRAARLRPGRMYPALTRMLRLGFLSDGWEETSEIEELRPPRRWYRITDDGRTAAARPDLGRLAGDR